VLKGFDSAHVLGRIEVKPKKGTLDSETRQGRMTMVTQVIGDHSLLYKRHQAWNIEKDDLQDLPENVHVRLREHDKVYVEPRCVRKHGGDYPTCDGCNPCHRGGEGRIEKVKQQGATQGGKQEYDTNGDKKVVYDVKYLDGDKGVSIPASDVHLQGGEIRALHIPEEIKESPFVFVKRDVDKDKGKGIIGIKKECHETLRRSRKVDNQDTPKNT
jgi:hypothetical protein